MNDVKIKLDAYCHDCKQWHRNQEVDAQGFHSQLWQWFGKHKGHSFEFLTPKRRIAPKFDDRIWQKLGLAPWWLEYAENADLKIAYNASAALTITLASLASSATFVVGRESTAIVNTTNKFIDYRVDGIITTGTTPTVNTEIRVYAYASRNDTPNYPDGFTGSDAAKTVTNTQILDNLALLGSSFVSATSDVAYPFNKLVTIAGAYGIVPTHWGLFVSHATAVNLNATGGNHAFSQTGAYFTV